MNVAQKGDKLIEAMHATNGERHGKATDWLAWACFYPDLRDALCAVFRGQMPTHQKLGQWFAEHQGQHVGQLVLQGQHSLKRKGWIWRSVPKERLEPPPIPQPASVAVPAPQPAAVQAHQPPPDAPKYEYEAQKYDSTGRPLRRELLIDPRTGDPMPKRAELAEQPKPEPEIPQTRVEQMRARYVQHHESVGVGVGGWTDPGGVVSQNMTKEQRAAREYCHVAGNWPGGFR